MHPPRSKPGSTPPLSQRMRDEVAKSRRNKLSMIHLMYSEFESMIKDVEQLEANTQPTKS